MIAKPLHPLTGTAAYMKLWVNGNAVALNHNLNRLGAVIPMASGTYPVVCQYSIDGTTGINSSALEITYGDSSLEYLDLQNTSWTAIAGCSGSGCEGIGVKSQNTSSDTWDGTGTSREFSGTDNGTTNEDEDWYQKRAVNMSLPDAWIYDFWLTQSTVPHALEFGISDCYENSNSQYIKYRMAFQADYFDNPSVWKVFSPTATDQGGSAGTWTATNLQPPDFTTGPNNGFTHVFFAGHPSTDGEGNPTVVIDAIQIGAGSGTSPGNAGQIVNIAVDAYTDASENCAADQGGQFNLQSAQLDLDTTYTSDTFWMDDVAFHFQP